MSHDSSAYFPYCNTRPLKYFNVVRHHEDGDRQLCSFWCSSIEEAVIEVVYTLAVAGWHIDSVSMNCNQFDEEELFAEVNRQNIDNEFFKIVEHFNDNQS